MTPAQRVGQLLMVATPAQGSTSSGRAFLARYDIGNVILVGASSAGVDATATSVRPVRAATTQAGVAPYVAVDQEGGMVQHLTGPGFSTVPSALHQGQLPTTTLRSDWKGWAGQLRKAGLTMDLAPVADVVPASVGRKNQPIGRYDREYGYTTSVVSPHAVAALRGIGDAHVTGAVKHFPGLGRASGNTDVNAGVTDPTTRSDPYLQPFRSAINSGAQFVMVSTAIYPHIDGTTVAAFSHLVVTTMLRHDLGFDGVIVSDSLVARSVASYSYADRAVRALDAGIDVLLVTTTAPVAAMVSAITERMKTHGDFAAVVKTAVMRVLTAKARAGLIRS
jgi:beta-N-acetylhexosaminidase